MHSSLNSYEKLKFIVYFFSYDLHSAFNRIVVQRLSELTFHYNCGACRFLYMAKYPFLKIAIYNKIKSILS